MDTQVLLDAVAAEFAVTGAGTPPWPDPHPAGAEPLDEEYSRCLDPGRYRILGARAEAWTRALGGTGSATAETVDDLSAAWREEPRSPIGTATRLRAVRAGTVPLLLGLGESNGIMTAVIGAGEPAVVLTTLPDCGCDACDTGSEQLLAEFDEYVLAVVAGGLLHVTTPHGTIIATDCRWSSDIRAGYRRGGYRDVEAILTEARAGRSPHRVIRGACWV